MKARWQDPSPSSRGPRAARRASPRAAQAHAQAGKLAIRRWDEEALGGLGLRLVGSLPLQREPYMSLVKAVLACPHRRGLPPRTTRRSRWCSPHTPAPSPPASSCATTPTSRPVGKERALDAKALAKVADHLSNPPESTVNCVQRRAQTLSALYARLDRYEEPTRASSPLRDARSRRATATGIGDISRSRPRPVSGSRGGLGGRCTRG